MAKVTEKVIKKLEVVTQAMLELEKKQLAGEADNVDWSAVGALFVEGKGLVESGLVDARISKDPKALRLMGILAGKIRLLEDSVGGDTPSGIAATMDEAIVKSASASQRDYTDENGDLDVAKLSSLGTDKINAEVDEIAGIYNSAGQTGTANVGNPEATGGAPSRGSKAHACLVELH